MNLSNRNIVAKENASSYFTAQFFRVEMQKNKLKLLENANGFAYYSSNNFYNS